MIKQHPLTLLAPVKKEKLTELYELLNDINYKLKTGTETEFKKLKTIHYARWFILSRESFRDEPAIPITTRLVFSSNYDGDQDEHLTELVTVLQLYIDQLYNCCEGYPSPEGRTTESRKAYLKKMAVKTSAFFNGAPGRSLSQIHQEDSLHRFIWNFTTKNKWAGKSAVEIHRAIRQEVDSKPEFEWAKQKVKVPKEKWHVLAAYILFVVVPLLPLIILWALYIFLFHELRDKYIPTKLSQINDKLVKTLEEAEDLFPQNQFTQAVVMKPGFARSFNFQVWMLRTRVLAGNIFVKGKLLNIPTIHFARWVTIDHNKHVLFFSNFDGNWQQYLGDFIDQSGWGLSGIFSNTVNFPRTHFMGILGVFPGMPLRTKNNFLLTGGAYDEEHFLAWSRSTQVPTQVWYSPYPNLSIKNINNNTTIRNELRKDLSEKEAQQFLKRI